MISAEKFWGSYQSIFICQAGWRIIFPAGDNPGKPCRPNYIDFCLSQITVSVFVICFWFSMYVIIELIHDVPVFLYPITVFKFYILHTAEKENIFSYIRILLFKTMDQAGICLSALFETLFLFLWSHPSE